MRIRHLLPLLGSLALLGAATTVHARIIQGERFVDALASVEKACNALPSWNRYENEIATARRYRDAYYQSISDIWNLMNAETRLERLNARLAGFEDATSAVFELNDVNAKIFADVGRDGVRERLATLEVGAPVVLDVYSRRYIADPSRSAYSNNIFFGDRQSVQFLVRIVKGSDRLAYFSCTVGTEKDGGESVIYLGGESKKDWGIYTTFDVTRIR